MILPGHACSHLRKDDVTWLGAKTDDVIFGEVI